MTQIELDNLMLRLIALPKENEYVEFKENNYKLEEIGKRISALSNSAALVGQKYGYLVFGIEDATHKVVGSKYKPTHDKIGNEEIELWLSRMLNPRIDFRIYEFQYQGKDIALFQIPAANNLPVLFQHISYIRIGSLTKQLKDFPEKERKLWHRNSSEFELEIAMRNVSESDIIALLDTQMIFDRLLQVRYPSHRDGVIEKLLEEKMITRDNGHFNITNLGALLFAKDLTAFGMERKAPRVIKYKGKGKFQTEKDQTGQLGYAVAFERLLLYISGLLPSNELIETATRREVQMYPPLSVRELIANSIIHQDFRETGTFLTIEIYDDRIEISNPGIPVVDTKRFIDSYNTRNSLLANAMRRMGFCEEKGSGIDKVIYECEFFQLPAPDFRVRQNQTIVTLFAHQAFKNMDKADRIRAAYQHCCLMYVTNQKMTNQTLRERFKIEGKNAATVSRIIKETIEEDFIKLENPNSKSKKHVSYIPFWA